MSRIPLLYISRLDEKCTFGVQRDELAQQQTISLGDVVFGQVAFVDEDLLLLHLGHLQLGGADLLLDDGGAIAGLSFQAEGRRREGKLRRHHHLHHAAQVLVLIPRQIAQSVRVEGGNDQQDDPSLEGRVNA